VRRLWRWIGWIVVIAGALLYPMLISIYVTLPLFIGFAGYLFLLGLQGRGTRYLVVPGLYLINLEINLSLPLFLTLAAVLLTELFVYPRLHFFKRCSLCVAMMSVLAIDLIYLGLIVLYDFIFASGSIEINSLLLYSLAMDLLAVVML